MEVSHEDHNQEKFTFVENLSLLKYLCSKAVIRDYDQMSQKILDR